MTRASQLKNNPKKRAIVATARVFSRTFNNIIIRMKESVYLEIKEDSDKIIKLLGVETRKSRLCRVVSTILIEEIEEMVTSGL